MPFTFLFEEPVFLSLFPRNNGSALRQVCYIAIKQLGAYNQSTMQDLVAEQIPEPVAATEQNLSGSEDKQLSWQDSNLPLAILARPRVRILCISDDVDALVYSSGIQARFAHIDMILSAGDLYFNYYNYIVSMLNKPLYFVFGNHNLKHLRDYRKSAGDVRIGDGVDLHKRPAGGGTYVGDKVLYLKKYRLIIAGLGGCKRYSCGPNQFSEFQMLGKMLKMLPRLLWNRIFHGRCLDILLTHAAPQGINDREDPCHKGFKVFLWFMRTFKPRYLLHGHIHLYDINRPRVAHYQGTQVINVYSRYELEL